MEEKEIKSLYNPQFMKEAIQLSMESIENGGGPFGALVVKDNMILARGNNNVTKLLDPTAHAEIVAIRNACRELNDFQLKDCIIYTSCEPCPMCLGAIYWARPKLIFFANTKADAAAIGFDDSFIYHQIDLQPANRAIPMIQMMHEQGLQVFAAWNELEDKTMY